MSPSFVTLLKILSKHDTELFLTSQVSQLWWDARRLIRDRDYKNPLFIQFMSGLAVAKIDVDEAMQQSVVWLPDHLLNAFPYSISSTNKIQGLAGLIHSVLPCEQLRLQLAKNLELLSDALLRQYPKTNNDDSILQRVTWLYMATKVQWQPLADQQPVKTWQSICLTHEPKITAQLNAINDQCEAMVAELIVSTRQYIQKLQKEGDSGLTLKKYHIANEIYEHLKNGDTTAITKINAVIHTRDLYKDILSQCRDSWCMSIAKASLFFVATAATLGVGSGAAYEKLYETEGQKIFYFEGRLFPRHKKPLEVKPSTSIELPVIVSSPKAMEVAESSPLSGPPSPMWI